MGHEDSTKDKRHVSIKTLIVHRLIHSVISSVCVISLIYSGLYLYINSYNSHHLLKTP